jgi:hypothetical protein
MSVVTHNAVFCCVVANVSVEPAGLITLRIQIESSFEMFATTHQTARVVTRKIALKISSGKCEYYSLSVNLKSRIQFH